MDPAGHDDPNDTRPSMDHSEEDAALALLNVSRTFLSGGISPQGVMGSAPRGAAPTATRHSKRQPKPVKKHKNDVGGFEKKDYTQLGFGGGRGRGRSSRGPGRPPKGSQFDPTQPGMAPYGYHYGAQMHPQYAPEYPPEYAPQYSPQYAPMYAPPPHMPPGAMPPGAMQGGAMQGGAMPEGVYGGQPYPGASGAPMGGPYPGMLGMMPYYQQPPYGAHMMPHPMGMPPMGPPHGDARHLGMPSPGMSPHVPLPVAPMQPAMDPAQAVPHLGAPPSSGDPAAIPVVKNIAWMQKHLDSAVGLIGRKAGEPEELDTLAPNWKIGSKYDPDLAQKTVLDLADYTQDQLQDIADLTVQEARLPPLVQPRPGVRVSRVASYTGSKEFYAGKIYHSAGVGHANRGGAASTATDPQETAQGKKKEAASWSTILGNPSSGLQLSASDSALALKISSCWRNENDTVWRLLGKAQPPVVERVQVNFLRLILAVESLGGYRWVTSGQKWGEVAVKFGVQGGPQVVAKAGHELRMIYMQHITPLWTFLQPFLPPLPVEGV